MSDDNGAATVDEQKDTEGGQSGKYTPPATQADLDRIIAARVSREREKFADYDDLKVKAAEHDKAVDAQKSEAQKAIERAEAAEAKVAKLETREQIATWKAEVARATGVPALALAGSTKEEIEAHAATLKPLIKTPGPVIPGQERSPDNSKSTSPEREFLRGLMGG